MIPDVANREKGGFVDLDEKYSPRMEHLQLG